MHEYNFRNVGYRLLLGITLPAAGIAIVIWTVVELLILQATHL